MSEYRSPGLIPTPQWPPCSECEVKDNEHGETLMKLAEAQHIMFELAKEMTEHFCKGPSGGSVQGREVSRDKARDWISRLTAAKK